MRHFRALAGWAKAFMILAIVSLFLSFTMIGAAESAFPELVSWFKKVVTWFASTIEGWNGYVLLDEHQWLYENVKLIAALIGILFLIVACLLYSVAISRAGKVYWKRQQNGNQATASTVVIGSTSESKKLMEDQAKEAKREEKMKKLAEIKAEKEAKKAAKKAAKEAAKKAKEEVVAPVADAAQDVAIAKVVETTKAAKTVASKSIDDVLNSMK